MVEIPQRGRWGPQPGNQPHVGPIYADNYAIRNLGRLGQVSPYTRTRMRAQHGRYLSGLGSETPGGAVGYDPAYQNQAPYELEAQDDVYGSGIFDPAGRPATSNVNMGVFASDYSLPGYAARDVPFAVSRDVSDITDDANVVYVPGGGMSYVEYRGKLTGPAVLGPTWRPPSLEPAGITQRDQPYAWLNKPGQKPAAPLNPNAPLRSPPDYRPGRFPTHWARNVPGVPPSASLALRPDSGRLGRQSIVNPAGAEVAVTSMGQADEPMSAVKLALTGAAVGVAAGLAVSYFSK